MDSSGEPELFGEPVRSRRPLETPPAVGKGGSCFLGERPHPSWPTKSITTKPLLLNEVFLLISEARFHRCMRSLFFLEVDQQGIDLRSQGFSKLSMCAKCLDLAGFGINLRGWRAVGVSSQLLRGNDAGGGGRSRGELDANHVHADRIDLKRSWVEMHGHSLSEIIAFEYVGGLSEDGPH